MASDAETRLNLFNRALSYLGAFPIESETGTSNVHTLMALHATDAIDTVWRSREWSEGVFVEWREDGVLQPSGRYRFEPPDNPSYSFLTAFRVFIDRGTGQGRRGSYRTEVNNREAEWEYNGGGILVQEYQAVDIVWGCRPIDGDWWPSTMRQLCALSIAKEICVPLTENRLLHDQINAQYLVAENRAQRADSQMGRRQTRANTLRSIRR